MVSGRVVIWFLGGAAMGAWMMSPGTRERHLALSVTNALNSAGLRDIEARVKDVILNRWDEVRDLDRPGCYQPMIELLLVDIRDIALRPNLTREVRRERIAWAMALVGV